MSNYYVLKAALFLTVLISGRASRFRLKSRLSKSHLKSRGDLKEEASVDASLTLICLDADSYLKRSSRFAGNLFFNVSNILGDDC
jgi:putative copper export protein